MRSAATGFIECTMMSRVGQQPRWAMKVQIA